MTKKKPVFGALSPLDALCIEYKLHPTCQKFNSLAEVQKQVLQSKELKRNWNVITLDGRIIMQKMKLPNLLPEYEVVADDSLGFTLSVFHWLLPEDHALYRSIIGQ